MMPDPTKQTLSATQTPALFGASPYLTKWMLLRHFIHGDPIYSAEHNRMSWGKKLQPLILAQAAEDLHLEVRPNETDSYVRSGQLGCTRDAEIICPDRGPGALETKCCFDFGTWMRDWDGGASPPRHIEIQLQQQMFVGDGKRPYEWGVLAVWVCGDIKYYERKPVPELHSQLAIEAKQFFLDVEAKREGEPFGEPIELPMLAKAFPVVKGKIADFTTREDAAQLAEQVSMARYYGDQRASFDKVEKSEKAKLRALLGDAEEAKFLHGIIVRAKTQSRAGYTVKPTSFVTLDIHVPTDGGGNHESQMP
jgi:hypothetical protein